MRADQRRRQARLMPTWLVDEFPALRSASRARAVIRTARVIAEKLDRPAFASNPRFWRLVFMAGQAGYHPDLVALRNGLPETFDESDVAAKLDTIFGETRRES